MRNWTPYQGGTVARLRADVSQDVPLVEDLYFTIFSRYPPRGSGKSRLRICKTTRASAAEAVEDLAWTLLNTLEFVFNH